MEQGVSSGQDAGPQRFRGRWQRHRVSGLSVRRDGGSGRAISVYSFVPLTVGVHLAVQLRWVLGRRGQPITTYRPIEI